MKTWRFVTAALVAGIAGCNDGVVHTHSSSSTSSSGAPTNPCGAGEHAIEGGACDSTLSFATSISSLKQARSEHASFVAESQAGAFLYVVGGSDGAHPIASVERARIHDDGSLGAFEQAGPPLPHERAGHALAMIGRTVVAIGGFTGGGLTAGTILANVDPITGKLGTWTPGPKLPEAVRDATAVAEGSTLYVVGGRSSQGPVATALRATVDASGVSQFLPTSQLPQGLAGHASVVVDHAIVVVGGATAAGADTASVLRAGIQPTGELESWRQVGALAAPSSSLAASVRGDRLYVVGGMSLGAPTNEVVRASLEPDGVVGAFQTIATLPTARAIANAPLHRSFLFVAGGAASAPTNEVDVGSFE